MLSGQERRPQRNAGFLEGTENEASGQTAARLSEDAEKALREGDVGRREAGNRRADGLRNGSVAEKLKQATMGGFAGSEQSDSPARTAQRAEPPRTDAQSGRSAAES